MGLFGNDSSNQPVPGGSLTKPVLIALGALLVGRMFSGKNDAEQPEALPDQSNTNAANDAGGGGLSDALGGGLGGLGGILGGMLGGVLGGSSPASSSTPAGGGSVGGGLGGLLEQLTKAGHADKVDSWVGNGQNAPIEPDQLGNAIGQNTISDIAKQAGVNESELLQELSQALPGIIDKLTANGKVPNMQELLQMFGNKEQG